MARASQDGVSRFLWEARRHNARAAWNVWAMGISLTVILGCAQTEPPTSEVPSTAKPHEVSRQAEKAQQPVVPGTEPIKPTEAPDPSPSLTKEVSTEPKPVELPRSVEASEPAPSPAEQKMRGGSEEAPIGDLSQRPNPLRTEEGEGSRTQRPEPVQISSSSFSPARKSEPSESPKEPSVAKPKRKGKHSGEPFDPIKENGPIFQGWPKPRLALVISGRQDGYLEPCGCAGLERMKGGLSRRYSMLAQLRQQGWPVVAVDVGGQGKSFGRQAVLKFQMSVDALKQMDYTAVTFGTNDLRLPAGEVLAITASVPDQPPRFISANVALFGFAAEMTPKLRIVEQGGKRIGITGVLGKSYQKLINNPDVEMVDPEKGLESVVGELKKQTDLRILLAHASMEESIDLAKRFPDFDVVVTAGGPPEPPQSPKMIEGTKTLLIEVGEKGMNVIVVGFFDDPTTPVRYQRVPLDSRFPQSSEIKLLMANYQTQLRVEGLTGLGVRPAPHPKQELLGRFVGSKECELCHEKSYEVWKRSGHAKAWKTLKELDPPRDADPECISCHVVGWHGQQYFPYQSGFLSEKETPHLAGVGCESCHGPGQKHVEAEKGADENLQKKLRKAVRVTKEESEKHLCYTCHDLDNSPDFDFPSYWPDVEHKED